MDALTRGGFRLGVAAGTSPLNWRMTGDARLVARGELLPAAAARPDPPSW